MNLHQICLVQICCKYEICTKTGKFGHCHLCTGSKALQISYLQHTCTRQIWGKFNFSSSDLRGKLNPIWRKLYTTYENINIQEASESEESSEDKSEDDALVNEECQKNTNKETPGKFTTMMNYEIPLVGMSARSAAR